MPSVERASTPSVIGVVGKTAQTQYGALSTIRLYAGRLEKGMAVLNASTGKRDRVGRILKMHAEDHIDLTHAEAGDVVAVMGLKSVRAIPCPTRRHQWCSTV